MDKKRIAVIEDDVTLSKVMCDELSDAGFSPFPFLDGESGLAFVQKEKPDLVLLDIYMPKKDGVAVLKELKASPDTKDIPVLILTVSMSEKRLREAVELGAEGYRIKSEFAVGEIVESLKSFF